MSVILVTGATSGLGRVLSASLKADGHHVIEYALEHGLDVRRPDLRCLQDSELDVLINCAGVNEINWCEDVTEWEWDRVVDTNAKGIFLMTQACLPWLARSKGTVINIVSNAAHMPMTCSAAYNASKGAALILTKQLARELTRRHGITVFSVSPNKMRDTAMSDHIDQRVTVTRGWSLDKARDYQLGNLLTGEETPPERVAELITFLLQSKERHKYLTGCDIPYGA